MTHSSDAPWWARSAWQLGPMALIAILLVLGLATGRLTVTTSGTAAAGDVKELASAVRKNTTMIEEHKTQTAEIIQLLRDAVQIQRENQAIQRHTCRNTAKSETARMDCDR